MKETRLRLLSIDDRLLEDAGFSRALLKQGIKAWPWRSYKYESITVTPWTNDTQAAADLRSFTDKDLRDLGINRGEIDHVVEHGRVGFRFDKDLSAA